MRRLCGLALWVLAASAADAPLALTVLDPSKSAVGFTWQQVRDGQAAITLVNPNKDPENATAELGPFHPDMSGGEPISWRESHFELEIPGGGVTRLPLTPVNAPTRAGGYSGFLVVNQAGQKSPQMIQIRITGTTGAPMVSRLTFTLTRVVPFLPVFLSLRAPVLMSAGALPPAEDGLYGTLSNDAGGWIGLRRGGEWADGRALFEVYPAPPSDGAYKGDVSFASGADKSVISLTVLVRDFVLWPILVIGVGTWLAYLVKRYLGVLRITWSLRQQEAETSEAFAKSQAQFRRDTDGKAYATYSIAGPVKAMSDDVLARAKKLEASVFTSIDDRNPDYATATDEMQKLSAAVAQWATTGGELNKLADGVVAAQRASAQAEIEEGVEVSGPPKFVERAGELLRGKPLRTLAELDELRKNVADVSAVAGAWAEAVQNVSGITATFHSLDLKGDDAKAIHSMLVDLWGNLWSVNTAADLESLTKFDGPIQQATNKVNAAKPVETRPYSFTLGLTNRNLLRVADLDDLLTKGAEMPAAVSDQKRAELVRHKIQIGDREAAAFSFVVALLTGLNTYYIGKPFGTVGDYVTIFIWAAGTKAVLDVLSGVLDKLASPSASPASTGSKAAADAQLT